MFLPPIKRLVVEDFKDQEQWIGKLISPINQVFLSLSSGLQNGLTFKENIASQIATLTFNNNASELSATTPLKFKCTLSAAPTGMFVLDLVDVSTTAQPLTSAPFCTRTYDSTSGQVRITAITGLVANQSYKLTLLVI